MPPAETEITVELVRSLLEDQRPDLADREVVLAASGWDNLSFRVGTDLVARFPRRSLAAGLIAHEAHWLPKLAGRLPLPVPTPLFLGRPGRGYPWQWSIVPWLAGRPAAGADTLDLEGCASALGGFLRALHEPAPPDAPENPYRGGPLRQRHEPTVERIDRLADIIDPGAARRRWEQACAAPEHGGPPMWIHGDLHPNNLLVSRGRITAVVDFGDLTGGDPATDLAVAWMLFPSDLRPLFVDAYGKADEPTWERAAGWAISLATAYLAFSADNPVMGEVGKVTLGRVLGEG